MAIYKKYAQVGLGGRHQMWRDAVISDFADKSKMVAMCDSNEGRLRLSINIVETKTGVKIPGYKAENFDQMIADTKPDCVIVTTRDCQHDHYICRALEMGCDVITEKPLTIDEKRCQRIIDMQRKTGKKCTVGFNYRYAPTSTQIKDLLMSGVIGEVLSVDFSWLLDIHHGADYFRRWHRNKANSGGLMVHKATHHFDIMNWWLSTVPETVYAAGHRKFYTPETAEHYGLKNRTERCLDCPEHEKCPFHFKLGENENDRMLYLECEQYDGYYRDQCVFSDKIDIEDSMNLVVSYQNGVKMSYSLNAFCPWEGRIVNFNGTKGRLEYKCCETSYTSGDGNIPGELIEDKTSTRIYPHRKSGYKEKIWTAKGGHGGADPIMLKYIFDPDNQPDDKYMRAADINSGAWSILVGIAANHSMVEERQVRIDELVNNIDIPEYPLMHSNNKLL